MTSAQWYRDNCLNGDEDAWQERMDVAALHGITPAEVTMAMLMDYRWERDAEARAEWDRCLAPATSARGSYKIWSGMP